MTWEGLSTVKDDMIWIKKPTRELRDNSEFSYADLRISDDETKIAVIPREGGEVTATAYKVNRGKIHPESISEKVSYHLLEHGTIAFETSYDSSSDLFIIDFGKPRLENTAKANIISYIRQNTDLDGSTATRLTKREMLELLDCGDDWELANEFERIFSESDYSVNLTFNLNKEAYAKLAEDYTNP